MNKEIRKVKVISRNIFSSHSVLFQIQSTIKGLILFENLFKPRQLHLAVGMVTDFVSSIHNLKTVF